MSDLEQLTVTELRAICRDRCLRGYSRFNKSALVEYVRQHLHVQNHAARMIQRAFRQWIRRPTHVVNDDNMDVFTMEPLGLCTYVVRAAGGKGFKFNCASMLNYMLTSGKFINPFTREPLRAGDIVGIQNTYFQHHAPGEIIFKLMGNNHMLLPTTNLLELRHALKHDREQAQQREQAIEYITDTGREVIHTVIGMADDLPMQTPDIVSQVMLHIMDYHIPMFMDDFADLVQLHPENAYIWLGTMIDTVGNAMLRLTTEHVKVQVLWPVYKLLVNKCQRTFRRNHESDITPQIDELVQTHMLAVVPTPMHFPHQELTNLIRLTFYHAQ